MTARKRGGTGGGAGAAGTGGAGTTGTLPEPVHVVVDAPLSMAARLERSQLERIEAAPLWVQILTHSELIGFDSYRNFIDGVFGQLTPGSPRGDQVAQLTQRRPGLDPYQLLRVATEVFLLTKVGAWNSSPQSNRTALEEMLHFAQDSTSNRGGPLDSDTIDGSHGRGVLSPDETFGDVRADLSRFLGDQSRSYVDAVLPSLLGGATTFSPSPFSVAGADPSLPCLLELIWSYWHEEGMLAQTTNAIARRFQNVRRPGHGPDPLGEFELAPLRPLSTLLWGYVNDEPNRLSVVRRAYEYQHHYGLPLYGKATQGLSPADCRTQFVEAFHELLRRCALFYLQDDDATVTADAFPVLQALKEVHLELAEGAHNQFRDLPWTSRAEMLVEQWLMAQPQMRDFLRGRWMIPYPELWMGGVDAMKRLQGWTDTSAIHFRDLGVFGERLLLSIRYYAWMNENDQEVARTWARFWRPEVQSYLHAYRVVTGVDLSSIEYADATPPSEHLRRRLAEQRQGAGAFNGSGARGLLGASSPNGASRALSSRARGDRV